MVVGQDHEVVGQRLTFPFPFVHQQPHDCGNKTINRWETSLWNLSYNLSAVNLVSHRLRRLTLLLMMSCALKWKVEERLQVFPSSMSFLLTVGFLKVGNQPITGNAKKGRTPVIYISSGDTIQLTTYYKRLPWRLVSRRRHQPRLAPEDGKGTFGGR